MANTETKHFVLFDETTVLANIQKSSKGKIRQAIKIKKHHNNLNLDKGTKIYDS